MSLCLLIDKFLILDFNNDNIKKSGPNYIVMYSANMVCVYRNSKNFLYKKNT